MPVVAGAIDKYTRYSQYILLSTVPRISVFVANNCTYRDLYGHYIDGPGQQL